MAEEHTRATRRSTLLLLIRRALGRPYLFMAAVLLVIGALWFIRLALEEFLLLDRLVNVYTDEAQIKMDTFAIKPGVTAEVLEVLVQEGDPVQKGQVLVRLAPDDILAELRKAQAVAEGIAQQLQDASRNSPGHRTCAWGSHPRPGPARNQGAGIPARPGPPSGRTRPSRQNAARTRGQSRSSAGAAPRARHVISRGRHDLQRTRTLFADGIVPRTTGRRTACSGAARARLQAAQEQVYQIQEQYPARDSPHMTRVHEKDLQRHGAEIKEQRVALELASTNLRLVETGEQRRKVVEAKYQEALAQVETAQLHLAKTTMLSPVDGIVGYRKVEPGETVKGDAGHPHHAHP